MFIQNNGRYAFSFTIEKNGRETKVVFDRKRVFLDTGNIATTGITKIDKEDFELLMKLKPFEKMFNDKIFVEVKNLDTLKNDAGALKAKDAEIATLKEKLKEADEAKNALEEKDNEITALKAQIEALSKNKKTKTDKKDETEGF